MGIDLPPLAVGIDLPPLAVGLESPTLLFMSLHIRKLCVGAVSIEDLERWQKSRLAAGAELYHRTRTWPRRHQEIVGAPDLEEANAPSIAGSLYWIIKGEMSCRQEILRFESEAHEDPDERPYCRIYLKPGLIRTEPWPHRPFQGWRYLIQAEAPPDLSESAENDDLPAALAAELRALGAW